MSNSNVIGIDLAKNVVQVCKLNIASGEVVYNKAINSNKLAELLAKEKPAIVAMEGCGGAHFWARKAQSFGHDARIIPPKTVKAFLQGQKTDANDAMAIAIAAIQIGTTFSRIKSETQHTLQSIESSRRFLIRSITALSNHIRAFMYEYGINTPQGYKGLTTKVLNTLDADNDQLPSCLKGTLSIMWHQLQTTKQQLKQLENEKAALVQHIEPCKRLMKLEGVGVVAASMLYASLGDGSNFKNGRAAAVYLGLTPKQHSSGGKTYLTGISKTACDRPLRSVLYQGALAVIQWLPSTPRTQKEAWLIALVARVGIKRACIALANKTVRTAWAMLSRDESYRASPLIN